MAEKVTVHKIPRFQCSNKPLRLSVLYDDKSNSSLKGSLTLPMLRLFLSKAQRCKYFWKPSKPCHFGTHWKALAEYSQMSTHLPGFQSFFSFLHHFVSTKIATSSVRVKKEAIRMTTIKLSKVCSGNRYPIKVSQLGLAAQSSWLVYF